MYKRQGIQSWIVCSYCYSWTNFTSPCHHCPCTLTRLSLLAGEPNASFRSLKKFMGKKFISYTSGRKTFTGYMQLVGLLWTCSYQEFFMDSVFLITQGLTRESKVPDHVILGDPSLFRRQLVRFQLYMYMYVHRFSQYLGARSFDLFIYFKVFGLPRLVWLKIEWWNTAKPFYVKTKIISKYRILCAKSCSPSLVYAHGIR